MQKLSLNNEKDLQFQIPEKLNLEHSETGSS